MRPILTPSAGSASWKRSRCGSGIRRPPPSAASCVWISHHVSVTTYAICASSIALVSLSSPKAVVWGAQALGLPIHDNWWQTETGGIMISNFAAMTIRPGSMGRPLPGDRRWRLCGGWARTPVEVVQAPDVEGELALKPGWPSMFRGYLHEEARYRKCFVSGWYLSGDLARRDADGYFWFVGRADDIIKTAGHMVGPSRWRAPSWSIQPWRSGRDRQARPGDWRACQGLYAPQTEGTAG